MDSVLSLSKYIFWPLDLPEVLGRFEESDGQQNQGHEHDDHTNSGYPLPEGVDEVMDVSGGQQKENNTDSKLGDIEDKGYGVSEKVKVI